MSEKIKKGDIVEILYAGFVNDTDELFDTNIEKIARDNNKYTEEHDYDPIKIIVGEGQVIKGLDNFLVGKEENKEYKVVISPEDGFGLRDNKKIRTFPLSQFNKQKINLYPGMVLSFENGAQAKVLSVSSGRVKLDFNHVLAGKELRYYVKVIKIIKDEEEIVSSVIEILLGKDAYKNMKYNKENKELSLPKEYAGFSEIIKSYLSKYVKDIKIVVATSNTDDKNKDKKRRN